MHELTRATRGIPIERIIHIIKRKCDDEVTFGELAKELGVSTCRVQQIYWRGVRLLLAHTIVKDDVSQRLRMECGHLRCVLARHRLDVVSKAHQREVTFRPEQIRMRKEYFRRMGQELQIPG